MLKRGAINVVPWGAESLNTALLHSKYKRVVRGEIPWMIYHVHISVYVIIISVISSIETMMYRHTAMV